MTLPATPIDCPVLLINLGRSPERLADAARQFSTAGICFERIEAIDGRALGEAEISRLCPDNSGRFFSRLTPGEVGAYLSHLGALRTMVDRGMKACIVFEDDFELEPGFGPCVRDILGMGDSIPDLVKLHGSRRRGETLRTLPCGSRLVRSCSPPICLACTLWTLRGARKMLERGGAVMLRPVDVQVKHWWEQGLDVQWVSPPPVVDSARHKPRSTIGCRRVQGLGGRLRKLRYRLGYAVRSEWMYAARYGLTAWARSLRDARTGGR